MLVLLKPQKDTFITNKIISEDSSAENSNMGLAGALLIFHFSGSNNLQKLDIAENSRILMSFDLTELDSYSQIGFDNKLSASYYLKMWDAPVNEFLPGAFELTAQRVSGSFLEGNGFDLQAYTQLGATNWLSKSIGNLWDTPGGDLYPFPVVSQSFNNGYENMYMDITPLVTATLADGLNELNICVKLPDDIETGSSVVDYKVFYSKDCPNDLAKPKIFAGVESDLVVDQRSDITPGVTGSIYMVYSSNGTFANIPDVANADDVISVELSSSIGYREYVSGSYVKTGFYDSDFAIPFNSLLSSHLARSGSLKFVDIWRRPSDNAEIYRGEFFVNSGASQNFNIKNYKTSMPKLKAEYSVDEVPVLRLFIQDNSRQQAPSPVPMPSISEYLPGLRYEIRRVDNNALVIPASNFTQLNSHSHGSFFWFPMKNLSEGYLYEINYFYYEYGQLVKLNKDGFQFKVSINTSVDGN